MSAEPLEPLVELDDRGRTNLRRFGGEPHARYRVTVRVDGTIIFHPAVTMTAHEAAMWREKPDLMRAIAGHVSGQDPMEMIPVSLDDL